MQSINHGKYINYLILQSNSEIDVLHEGKGNSWFPEDLRQGMIKKKKKKKRPAVLLCVSSIQIFIHLPIISSHFPLQDHFISFETYNWIKSAFSTGQKELHKYWWSRDRDSPRDRPLRGQVCYRLWKSLLSVFWSLCLYLKKKIIKASVMIFKSFVLNATCCNIISIVPYSLGWTFVCILLHIL